VGAIYILISGAAFGLLPWFARIAYDHDVEPLGLLTVRFLIAMVCLVILHTVIRRHIPWPSRQRFGKLVALGALGYAPQSAFFFFGVERIDISLATVIFYTYPIMVVVLSWTVLKNRPSRAITLSLIVAVCGAALTAGQIRTGSWTGVFLMLIAAAWYSGYIIVVSRMLKDIDPFMSLTVIMIGAAAAHTFLWLFHRAALPTNLQGWSAATAAAVVSTILALGFLIAGVQRIGPSQSSVLSTIEPVVSISVGVMALNETLTVIRVVGATLIVLGVAMMARSAQRSVASHEYVD
jgi:drug/metabolite transporter (DMT)-like permease